MHIKFLGHGTGDPHRAVDYLLAGHDYKGKPRPVVLVLRGDPHRVADVASCLRFVHRYTSCVIAWTFEDAPTLMEVGAVLDGFLRTAVAGLSLDRVSYTAIWHGDHVHIIFARVDLLTGKSFNVAPPGWKGAFYPLRDYWNGIKGWARPQDVNRARFLAMPAPRPRPQILQEIEEHTALGFPLADIETALHVEPDTRFLIADWLIELIHEGKVMSYNDVLGALNSEGTVIKKGTNSVLYLVKETTKPIKLVGRLFSQNFQVSEVLDRPLIREKFQQGRADFDPLFVLAAFFKMKEITQRRVTYNQEHYKLKGDAKLSLESKARPPALPGDVGQTARVNVPRVLGPALEPARSALVLARQAIARCAEVVKAKLQRSATALGSGSVKDQLALERAIQAYRELKKLGMRPVSVDPIKSKR